LNSSSAQERRVGEPCDHHTRFHLDKNGENLDKPGLDHEIALASTALPELHNDPFDRILVATAQPRNLRLVSKDAQLARYPVIRAVWS
jgi:PIN domain nuclease of toxin-antitoxin system